MSLAGFSRPATRQLGRWLARWGVDADQYHWLLQASLKMDFRSRSALPGQLGSSRTKSALIKTGIFYGIFSLMLSLTLRTAGVGTFCFSTVTFAYAMTMMAMSILMEFGLVVSSPDDFLILAHRPISSRTFFAAKFSNLLFYTLLLDLCLNLVPALIGWTFPDAPWHFPLAYLAVALVAGAFVASVVAALYGLLLQRVNYERFKDLLAWCQIIFSFTIFFGYQLFPHLIGRARGFRIEDTPALVIALPPAWFASLSELGLGHFSRLGALMSAAAAFSMLLLLPGLLKSISLSYSDRIGGMISAASRRSVKSDNQRRGAMLSWLEGVLSFDQEERAMFGFLFRMLRRNRQLKLQLYPNFGIVIALFVLGALKGENNNDPLAGGIVGMGTMFPLMAFLFAAMGFAAVLPYSDEYQGSWIFHTAPIAEPGQFLKAIKKAVFLVLFVPLLLLNIVLFSFFWPLSHALVMSLYGLAIGLVAFQAALFGLRAIPFSLKPEKGAQSQRFAMVFVMMIGYGLFMALLALFRSHPAFFPAAAALLMGLALGLGWLNNRVYARVVRRLVFAAE